MIGKLHLQQRCLDMLTLLDEVGGYLDLATFKDTFYPDARSRRACQKRGEAARTLPSAQDQKEAQALSPRAEKGRDNLEKWPNPCRISKA